MRKTFIEKLTDQDKYSILYRYLIKGEDLKHIYESFRDKGALGRFVSVVANYLLNDKELLTKILRSKLPEEEYEEVFYILPSQLGSKRKSYWSTESEVLFEPCLPQDLSPSEKNIYYNI